MKTRTTKSSSAAGFTLVELALVVAVLAVAFIPLVALLPSGQQSFRGAMNVSICTQIAQRVLNDAAQANFETLIDRKSLRGLKAGEGFTFRAPTVQNPRLRYFDDQGTEIIPEGPELSEEDSLRAVYQVNTRVMPQAPVPTAGELKPAAAADANLAQITVEVAFVPASVELDFNPGDPDDVHSPGRNLFAKRQGTEVFTFSTLVGRGL